MMKKFLGILALVLFCSKVSAAPTHVTEFDISAQETVPTGIAFKSDGTKMFIVGITGDDIN